MQKKKKVLLFLFLASMLPLHLVLAWNSVDLIRKGYPDFTIFYSAGKIVRSGLGKQLYDEKTQYRAQQEFAAGVSIRQGPLPYNHPPFEALLFLPFTLLPYSAAYLLWDLLNLVILLIMPLLLRSHVPVLLQTPTIGFLFASLAFFPLFIALLQGQDVIVLLLLFTLAFLALQRKADFAGGGWLGLGLFRFHFVLPLMIILLLQKRYKAILSFLGVAALLGAISMAVVGWKGTISYPSYVLHVEQTMAQRKTAVPTGMPNLRGLLNGLLPAFPLKPWRIAALGASSLALILLSAIKWRTGDPSAFDLEFSAYVIVAILVSYHAFAYDLTLLILPVVLVANRLFEGHVIQDWSRLALLGPLFFLFLTPLQMALALRAGRYGLMAVVLLVLLWGITREIPQRKRASGLDSRPERAV